MFIFLWCSLLEWKLGGFNGRAVCMSYCPNLLLIVDGTCRMFRGPEGMCVFLNSLSEVQFTCNVYECSCSLYLL